MRTLLHGFWFLLVLQTLWKALILPIFKITVIWVHGESYLYFRSSYSLLQSRFLSAIFYWTLFNIWYLIVYLLFFWGDFDKFKDNRDFKSISLEICPFLCLPLLNFCNCKIIELRQWRFLLPWRESSLVRGVYFLFFKQSREVSSISQIARQLLFFNSFLFLHYLPQLKCRHSTSHFSLEFDFYMDRLFTHLLWIDFNGCFFFSRV